ncbi:hypothetical protein SCUCBS95973_008799 [Sporothrix curviconia]|uniref:Sulfatase N-terminal domain-containing protein n=1 Tax=Sporothrix curviconia TaxID=1260050 RepID=A0ABP0CS72_9PEZI
MSSSAASSTVARRNVLLLVADDLGKQLGCYGCTYSETPEIDRLAAEGIRFDLAFASTASCSGSRSTLYTGLHTHQNGQYGLGSGKHHFMTFDHIDTAPAAFSRNGYRTGIIGKIHVGPDTVYPWDVRDESFTRDVSWIADRAGLFFRSASSSGAISEQEPSSSTVADNRPFFLTIGFHDPHRDQTRGGFGNDEAVDTNRVHRRVFHPDDVTVPTFLSDTPRVRREIASYAEAINRLDQGVGMVLEELHVSGKAKDTLVVFISDNGPPFLNSKTTLYDAGTCLPLIIRLPTDTINPPSKPSGSAGPSHPGNPNLVSYVDVLPTLLDWALGSDKAAGDVEANGRAGRSFLSLLDATTQLPEWDHVFGSHTFHESTNYWPTRYIRTRRYKYHRNIAWRLDFPFANDLYGSFTWEDVRNTPAADGVKKIGSRPLKDYFFRPPEQLYDLVADPEEVHDLASDASYHDVLVDLRTRLEDWQRRTNDPWLYRDGVSVLLNKRHLDAGLSIPDRWDLDIDNIATKTPNLPLYENKPFNVRGPRS